jgi:hypothetical protein
MKEPKVSFADVLVVVSVAIGTLCLILALAGLLL